MPNPYLPNWEYIPDGEPRVFGDRVYIYGSHDRAGSDKFCDYVLKCWSAPVDNLNQWVCHGDIFHTRADRDHAADTSWTKENNELYAPDVVEKDGKYYLYAYIVGTIGCVAVSERPEGPFTLLSQYKYTVPDAVCCNGWFIDPGVLVDDDGRVYIYCGFERSFMAEINAENMYEIIDGSCIEHIIPCNPANMEGEGGGETDHKGEMQKEGSGETNHKGEMRKEGREGTDCKKDNTREMGRDKKSAKSANPPTVPGMPVADSYGFAKEESLFFEACSPRKINGIYYLIYSPKRGSRLAYATSDSPAGPFTYRGYIVDNGADYPGGNDHGSVACIRGQWYIFYHRMTNGTIMSRRACVEKIDFLPDGTIVPVEMTSLGFEDVLSPYEITPAETACVLKGGALVTEHNVFERVVTNIREGAVLGYKYFDFGEDFSSKTMEFSAKIGGCGCDATLHIWVDGENEESGMKLGSIQIGHDSGVVSGVIKAVTGRHALYFTVTTKYEGWMGDYFKERCLFELEAFVFMK